MARDLYFSLLPLRQSRFGLDSIGRVENRVRAMLTIHHALDRGINFLDTAGNFVGSN